MSVHAHHDWAAENAAELKHFTGAHRARPLDEVEAEERAKRVAWPMTCGSCNVGTPGDCDCMPVVIDRLPEEYDDQGASADAEVGMLMLKGLGVVLALCFCVWLIAGGPDSDALAMLLALGDKP